MTKRICLILTLILIIFAGCAVIPKSFAVVPGSGDWELKLPNNYEIWRINSENISIGYIKENQLQITNSKGDFIGVGPYVIKYCSNKRFVGVKQVDQKVNQSNPKFYLLDTKEQKVYGQFKTENEFNEKCKELDVSNLSKWKKAKP